LGAKIYLRLCEKKKFKRLPENSARHAAFFRSLLILGAEYAGADVVPWIEKAIPYLILDYVNEIHFFVWTISLIAAFHVFKRVLLQYGFWAVLLSIFTFYCVAQPVASVMSDSLIFTIPGAFNQFRSQTPAREFAIAWPIVLVAFIHSLPAVLVQQFFAKSGYPQKTHG